VTEHYCEYDGGGDKPPCGKVARFQWDGRWLCAECWDFFQEYLKHVGLKANATINEAAKLIRERKRLQ
jgi:hypothetical protein